ncbi:MAG TPA: methyltransferase domain-containing protein [Thermomicrobiales bacterium]|jgi:SAM-dependent methyltransferase
MAENKPVDRWATGAAYEPYVGRWSRRVAAEFLTWLAVPPGGRWLDVGCGTGALTGTILAQAAPSAVRGADTSAGFIGYAQTQLNDPRVSFGIADGQALPDADGTYDAVVSGLALNFIPQPARALGEMARVTRPGGIVAAYVWDYDDGMQMMRHFWDAAVALDPAARALDEGQRFSICRPDALAALCREAGLQLVETRAIDIPTHFRDFDDYWSPFLGGQGSAPSYVASLDAEMKAAIRDRIRAGLPIASDGSISLIARAWAVRGRR